ncbi:hypothetical protein Tco_0399327, partial [Tanacetum coccineum]
EEQPGQVYDVRGTLVKSLRRARGTVGAGLRRARNLGRSGIRRAEEPDLFRSRFLGSLVGLQRA